MLCLNKYLFWASAVHPARMCGTLSWAWPHSLHFTSPVQLVCVVLLKYNFVGNNCSYISNAPAIVYEGHDFHFHNQLKHYYYYYYYYYKNIIIYYYFVSVKCSTTATELNVTWKNMINGTFKNGTCGYQVVVWRNNERVEVKNLNSSSNQYFLNRLGNYVYKYFPYFISSHGKFYIINILLYYTKKFTGILFDSAMAKYRKHSSFVEKARFNSI